MSSFSQLITSLKNVNMDEVCLRAIELSEADIVQVNTEQLLDGKTSTGDFLPDYSPVSVYVYGKRPGPWTLRDTGAFHNSFFLVTENFPVLFDAKDEKKSLIFDKLRDKGYVPETIFGVTQENRQRIAPLVRQRLKTMFLLRLR